MGELEVITEILINIRKNSDNMVKLLTELDTHLRYMARQKRYPLDAITEAQKQVDGHAVKVIQV